MKASHLTGAAAETFGATTPASLEIGQQLSPVQGVPIAFSRSLESAHARTAEIHETLSGPEPLTPLPEINEFAGKISLAAPAHGFMKGRRWEPFILFEPPQSAEDVEDERLTSGWDLVIISASANPAINQVSPNGKHGPNAASAVRELSKIPNLRNTSSKERIIDQTSPDIFTYNALQEALYAMGKMRVDARVPMGKFGIRNQVGSWSIGAADRETIETGMARCLYFFELKDRVGAGLLDPAATSLRGGIRPTFATSRFQHHLKLL